MTAFYYGGGRGYRIGDIIDSSAEGGLVYSKDINKAAKRAALHKDGDELHGGSLYRVSLVGQPRSSDTRLRVEMVVARNVSRAPYVDPDSVVTYI